MLMVLGKENDLKLLMFECIRTCVKKQRWPQLVGAVSLKDSPSPNSHIHPHSGTTTFKSWMEGGSRKEMWSEREESNRSTLSKELKKTSTCVLNKNKWCWEFHMTNMYRRQLGLASWRICWPWEDQFGRPRDGRSQICLLNAMWYAELQLRQ